MRVIFKKLIIQNLLSFGNTPTIIDFSNGLNLVTGGNGTGKSSSMLDGLAFVLYDKPYRKINKNDLINRKNKKGTRVEVEFEVNGTEFRLVRGLKNKDVDVEFYIDGQLQQLLSSKALSQEEIEKKIGIDYKLFKQIISLSINQTEPFLTLSLPDKREITEKFLNIDAIPLMAKETKDILRDLKVKKDVLNSAINAESSSLEREKSRILQMEETQKNFNIELEKEVESIDKRIVELNVEKKDIKDKAMKCLKDKELLSTEDNKLLLSNLKKDKEHLQDLISQSKFSITSSQKIIKYLDVNDICPSCNSVITEEHKSKEVKINTDEINKNQDLISSSEEKVKDIDAKISKLEQDDKKIYMLDSEIKQYKSRVKNILSDIERYENEKVKVQTKEFSVDIKQMKKDFNDAMKTNKSNKKEVEHINEEILIYNDVASVLSDSGVKSFIYKNLMPILNKSINHYLNIFELPVYIEFDSMMNDTIKPVSNFGADVKYMSFSEGEKKKIDMAILLSFIDVTKRVTNWNCNLLIIDELLDSSIDEVGLEKLLSSLVKMSELDTELGIFIISHRLKAEYKQYFDSTLSVTKNAEGFSSITKS